MKGKAKLFLSAFLLLFWLTAAFTANAQTEKEAAPKTVYIFLSETCPISQFYTLTLKELHRDFASDQLRFVGIFPNSYSTPETIAEFKAKYNLPFELQPDPEQKLTKKLKAEITPEAIIVDNVSSKVVYKGRIDDAYFRVGKRRSVIMAPDLQNALTELKNNKAVSKPETAAVGCYITLLP